PDPGVWTGAHSLFSTCGADGRESSTAPAPACPDSAPGSSSGSSFSCSSSAPRRDLLRVVAAVDQMKAHPLGQREVPEPRVFHEQVERPRDEQLGRNPAEALDAFPEVLLRVFSVHLFGGPGALRRLASRWKPAHFENQETRHPLDARLGTTHHRRLVAMGVESPAAPFERNRQVLDDLCRIPFAGGRAVPVGVGFPGQGAEDEIGERSKREHHLNNSCRKASPSAMNPSRYAGSGSDSSRHQINSCPYAAAYMPGWERQNARTAGPNS